MDGLVPDIRRVKKILEDAAASDSNSQTKTFKIPRDLTLGGTRTKKTNFVPNLNLIRNKDKPDEAATAKAEPQGKKRLQTVRVKVPNKRQKLQQSNGIFSQGMGNGKCKVVAEVTLRIPSAARGKGKGAHKTSAALVMPILSKRPIEVDKNVERSVIERLLRFGQDDSDSDSDGCLPTTLPLEIPRPPKETNDFDYKNIKKEVPGFYEDEVGSSAKNISSDKTEKANDCDFKSCLNSTKIYDDKNPAFLFIRLPKIFPGTAWKNSDKEDNEDKNNNRNSSLKDLQDGCIGKFLIRKSGKIEFQMRNTNYPILSESAGNALNTVALFPGEESTSEVPSLVTLGVLEEKLTLTPSWTHLFKKAREDPLFF